MKTSKDGVITHMCSGRTDSKDEDSVSENSAAADKNGLAGGVACLSATNNGNIIQKRPPTVTKKRIDVLKWNGWGYNDSQFLMKNDMAYFSGRRYPIGDMHLPFLVQWAKDSVKFDPKNNIPSRTLPSPDEYPKPIIQSGVLESIKSTGIEYSLDGVDRLVRAHGQTLEDIYMLRNGPMPRIPDLVVWPVCHEQVEKLVELASEHNFVIVPYGGGTSVSGAVTTPQHESRTIVALDTSQMNRILWVDKENLTICCEAGMIGQDLERALHEQGLTTGHEPDSYEFSSVGGWVATRASGMKKNTYGNIEDLLVQAKMVSPQGTLVKGLSHVPRSSIGPDFNHVILGSEGTLGVITEVVLKVRPLPPCRKYGSIVFPDFESGVKFMREVAKQRIQPSSIRLVDNEQFQFGLALRAAPTMFGAVMDHIKRSYLTVFKGFRWNSIAVTTLLFEGTKEDVAAQERKIYTTAEQFKGVAAGEKNGERGYTLTFVIAYLRDFAIEHFIIAESFETSVPWDKTLMLCRNVKHCINEECKALGIEHPLVSCRVTQTYDIGCCVYFYFAFNWLGKSEPVQAFERIEEAARDMIIACGGSLSHHHGVGKIRARWYPSQVSALGVELYKATKQRLDPANIFATGNLLTPKL
ncbi:hypothetical protein LSTR_LSTR003268 [Laodelphax striatellus]|uniref:Alkylglycerone-phosphate synthase n=1 Tax=Laodelphax striatellus TaxID=195883 RepID=A0A482XU02_LAOST|nr:hypothetical protein LSTR_LSTR003268 [Laodelphax striatellus]